VLEAVHASELPQAQSNYCELNEPSFTSIPNVSIDYAVMEKSARVAVVTCDIGWNDVGSWNALGDLLEPDALSNRITGEVLMHDTQNCLIQASGRVVATVGLRDLVVVDTPDALLVAHKDSVQNVKNIVGALKKLGHSASREHTTIFRPWGCYTVLEEGPGFKIKRIEVLPKHALSLQEHEHRSEHWVVVSGVAHIQNGDEYCTLLPSQSTYIQAGQKHRLSNEGPEPLVIIEVQCGTYLGEDDIRRYDDHYGRTPAGAALAKA
jgi:mannose-1-phosphate guanylyltransferase